MMTDTDPFPRLDDSIPNFEKLNSSGYFPTFDSFSWDDNALTKPKMSKIGTSVSKTEEAPRRIKRRGDGRKAAVDSAKKREVTKKASSRAGTAMSKKTSSRRTEDLLESSDQASPSRGKKTSRRTQSNSPVRRASSPSLSNSRRSSVSPVRREHGMINALNSPQTKREAVSQARKPGSERKSSVPSAASQARKPGLERKGSLPGAASQPKTLERKLSAPACSKSPIRTQTSKKGEMDPSRRPRRRESSAIAGMKNKTRMGDMDGSRKQRGNPDGHRTIKRVTSNPSISPTRSPLVSHMKVDMDVSRRSRTRGGGEMDTSRRQRISRRDVNDVQSSSSLTTTAKTVDGTASRAKDDMDVSSLRRRNRRRASGETLDQRTLDDMDVSAVRKNRRRTTASSPTASPRPKAEMDTSSQRRRGIASKTAARRTGEKKVGTQTSHNRSSAQTVSAATEERHMSNTAMDASLTRSSTHSSTQSSTSKTSKTSKVATRRANSAVETTPVRTRDGNPPEGGSKRSGRDIKRSQMRSQMSDTLLSLSPSRRTLDPTRKASSLKSLMDGDLGIPAPQPSILDHSLLSKDEDMLMDSSHRSEKDEGDLLMDSSHRSVGVARHPRRRNNKGDELMKRTLQRLEISNHVPNAYVQGSHLGGNDDASDEGSVDSFGDASSKPTGSLAARLERHKNQRDAILSSSMSVGGKPSGTTSGDDLLSSRSCHGTSRGTLSSTTSGDDLLSSRSCRGTSRSTISGDDQLSSRSCRGTRSVLSTPFSPTSPGIMMGFSFFKTEEPEVLGGSTEFSICDTDDYKPAEESNDEQPTNIFSPFE